MIPTFDPGGRSAMHIYRADCQRKVLLKPLKTKVKSHKNKPLLQVGEGDSASALSALVNHAAAYYFKMPIYTDRIQDDRSVRDFIAPAVFEDSLTGLARMVYKEVVIRFDPSVNERRRKQILDKHRLEIRSESKFISNQLVTYVADRKQAGENIIHIANDCAEMDEVIFATPNFVSKYRRCQIEFPIPPEQWHLYNRGLIAGQVPGEDVNAREAWGETQGAGCTVAVLDDGVDIDHPNLSANIMHRPDPNEPRDRCGRDYCTLDQEDAEHFNPRPKLFQEPYDGNEGNDSHGTPCAGLIAAAGNGAFGVAPQCSILPVRILNADNLVSDELVAEAIRYAALHADIISCSWENAESTLIETVIEQVSQNGRGGRGTPVFCASGNDFLGFATNGVAYPAAYDHAIAVGASTDKRQRAYYSKWGPELWVVAPSGGGQANIFTTDLSMPNRGRNPGNDDAGGADGLHTNAFFGTSASTPLAAGVAALMLSANPSLDRDAVKQIMADTADKIDDNEVYDLQTGHNDRYGHGRVNAGAAVEAAKRM
jgi:subtilisin family serine protease